MRKTHAMYPVLSEEERIYFTVPYLANGFAQACRCGFDTEKKLWFTGVRNRNLRALVELYGVNDNTSEEAKRLLAEKLGE